MKNELLQQPGKRWGLLGWLLMPCLLVVVASNYLVVTNNKVVSTQNKQVLSAHVKREVPELQKIPFTWTGTGLVTLWFDDAWFTQYTVGYQLLEQYNLKAALSVPTKLIGYDAYMNWNSVHTVFSSGWEITSHTRTHTCDIDHESLQKIEYELEGSLEDLEAQNIPIENFVSPCGVTSPRTLEIIKKYYQSHRSVEPGLNVIPVSNPFAISVRTITKETTLENITMWVNEAKNEHKWLAISLHQIDESNEEYSMKPELFIQMISLIRNSELPVVLPYQVLSITKDSLVSNTDEGGQQ